MRDVLEYALFISLTLIATVSLITFIFTAPLWAVAATSFFLTYKWADAMMRKYDD
jgi:hypothetical protein